jgi:hypothetical protein
MLNSTKFNIRLCLHHILHASNTIPIQEEKNKENTKPIQQ